MSIPPQVEDWASGHRFCVTGGRGVLGSRLAELVVFDAATPTSQDRNTSIRYVQGSILDSESLRSVVDGCHTVFHLAALTDVHRSRDQLERFFEVNAQGTALVGRACQNAGVHRIIYASTSHVYGLPEESPISEGHPLRPRSPYAASKVAGEAAMWGFALGAEVSSDILRLANIYDARSKPNTVVGRMLNAVALGEPIRVKSFSPLRGFLMAEEAAEAFVRVAAQRAYRGEYRIFNVSSDERYSIGEVAQALAQIARDLGLGDFAPEETDGMAYSDGDEIVLDSKRLFERVGWLPTITLQEGLRRCLIERLATNRERSELNG